MNFKTRNTLLNILYCSIVVILAVGINLAGSILAEYIVIPMYLDSLVTIAVTAACGLIPGIACAFLTNLMLTIIYKTALPFTLCHIFTAFLAWIVFRHEEKKNLSEKNIKHTLEAFLWAGLWSAFSNAILGNIIVDIFLSNNSGRSQIDATVQGIYLITGNLAAASYISGFLTNLVDKLLSATLSFFVYQQLYRIKEKIIR